MPDLYGSASRSPHQSSQYRIFTRNRFRFAPVSKFWCGCTLIGSCALIPFRDAKWHFILSYPSLIARKQNFLLLCSLTAFCLEVVLFSLIKEYDVIEVPFFATGPYSALFSCMVQYILDVPVVPYGRLMNIPLTGKLFPYLLALQIFFISPRVALSCFCGIIAGFVYRSNYFFPKYWPLIPRKVRDFSVWFLKPIVEFGEDKKGRILPFGATIEAQRQDFMDRFEQRLIFEQMRSRHAQDGPAGLPFIQRLFGQNPGVLPPVEVSESNIQILMDMGFTDRNSVVMALQGCNNDVSSAANFLLHNA